MLSWHSTVLAINNLELICEGNPDSKVHGANMGPTWVLLWWAPCLLHGPCYQGSDAVSILTSKYGLCLALLLPSCLQWCVMTEFAMNPTIYNLCDIEYINKLHFTFIHEWNEQNIHFVPHTIFPVIDWTFYNLTSRNILLNTWEKWIMSLFETKWFKWKINNMSSLLAKRSPW